MVKKKIVHVTIQVSDVVRLVQFKESLNRELKIFPCVEMISESLAVRKGETVGSLLLIFKLDELIPIKDIVQDIANECKLEEVTLKQAYDEPELVWETEIINKVYIVDIKNISDEQYDAINSYYIINATWLGFSNISNTKINNKNYVRITTNYRGYGQLIRFIYGSNIGIDPNTVKLSYNK